MDRTEQLVGVGIGTRLSSLALSLVAAFTYIIIVMMIMSVLERSWHAIVWHFSLSRFTVEKLITDGAEVANRSKLTIVASKCSW